MGSMAEMTPWMTNAECRHRTGMHLWQDLVYTQVCAPETFAPLPFGAEGTPVYTHLERTSQPMIRLVSGDLARWTDEPCPCGRTYPRLPDGLYGRIDDMFIVRGENIYPSAIEDTLRALEGFRGEFRVIVSRREAMDERLIRVQVDALAREVVEGSPRALARALTWVESGGERAETLVARLYAHTGRAHVVGITGAPGSGKSTLVRALACVARARGRTVGILAVDPSSPFSGGAILGDRIRMNDLTLDPGVFIRSMATRGALGGLCRAAADGIDVLDASGRGLILVETVGVGQDEVDVMRVAHTVVVVSVPGLGDDVQALKAGILEIADLHVVNKADREGADRTIAELRAMLTLMPAAEEAWTPPVLGASAAREEGVEAIADALEAHLASMKTSGELDRRRRRMVAARVLRTAQDLVAARLLRPEALEVPGGETTTLLDRVMRRELAPHACARALLTRMGERTPDV